MSREPNHETFLQNLETGIKTADIQPNHSIVCAVSGGIDSTALLLGLHKLRHLFHSLTAAHYNHRARGEESDVDEHFVRALCNKHQIPLTVGRANHDTPNLTENSARRDRYNFLATTADRLNANSIAVAHTINDQAETILLRITRGSGLRGAGGMKITRTIKTPSGKSATIIRPLLQTTREQAEQFLNSIDITARHDSSNDDWIRYARNRIRHRVTPELKALNPQAIPAIARFGEILQANTNLVEQLANDVLQNASTESPNVRLRNPIASAHPVIAAEALTKIYRAVANPETQLDQHHIDKLLGLISTGKSTTYHLPDNITFWTNHQHIGMTRDGSFVDDPVLYPQKIVNPVSLPLPGIAHLGNGYMIKSEISSLPASYQRANDGEAWLKLDLLQAQHLSIRNRQPSDRFNPLGMNQNVDLSKFLINSKVAATWRDRIPIVVNPQNNRIIWLPGIRIAEWAKVSPTDKSAVHLIFHYEPKTTPTQ